MSGSSDVQRYAGQPEREQLVEVHRVVRALAGAVVAARTHPPTVQDRPLDGDAHHGLELGDSGDVVDADHLPDPICEPWSVVGSERTTELVS